MLSLRDFLSEWARFTETTASLHKGFGSSFVEGDQSKPFVVLQAIKPRRKLFSHVFVYHLERRADFGGDYSDPASRHAHSCTACRFYLNAGQAGESFSYQARIKRLALKTGPTMLQGSPIQRLKSSL